MNENIEDQAFELLKTLRKVTPTLLMYKLKISYDMAKKLCDKISLRQHVEMRRYVREQQL